MTEKTSLDTAATCSAPESDQSYGLPTVMTVEETATFLRLNIKTVHAALKAGVLPGKKVGRRTVILRDALLGWLGSQERVLPRRGRSNR